MKARLALALIFAGLIVRADAQLPVTIAVNPDPNGFFIPADFSGLSFGAVAELPGHGGVNGMLFSPTNSQLVTLFKNSGLHNLRLGGSTVEGVDAAVPSNEAIDNVFGFARAVGDLDVIYSLRLLNGTDTVAAATAQYIWSRYRSSLVAFAIGNEPDIKRYHYPPFGTGTDPAITNYSSYLAAWRKFAAAVTNAVPGAIFAGPDAANRTFAGRFAADEKDSGRVSLITQHFYVGGRPFINGESGPVIPIQEAFDHMLSRDWLESKYPELYHSAVDAIVKTGMPWRMTELDDYLKGVPDASDAFGSALWALDIMHWFAAHGCVGVNFHNTEWLKTDTVYLDDHGNYQINPKAYAIKAFELGSHGRVGKVTLTNTNSLNLTAYAVGTATNLCVTIINKEHGTNAQAAAVTIIASGYASAAVAAMFLAAPDGDLAAKAGITLGGGKITNNAPWQGRWTDLSPLAGGRCVVNVPAASAVVVHLNPR